MIMLSLLSIRVVYTDGYNIMAKKKAYPLRINEDVLKALQTWADDELRSMNAQIEYLLRQSLVRSGRVKLTRKQTVEIIEEPQNKE